MRTPLPSVERQCRRHQGSELPALQQGGKHACCRVASLPVEEGPCCTGTCPGSFFFCCAPTWSEQPVPHPLQLCAAFLPPHKVPRTPLAAAGAHSQQHTGEHTGGHVTTRGDGKRSKHHACGMCILSAFPVCGCPPSAVPVRAGCTYSEGLQPHEVAPVSTRCSQAERQPCSRRKLEIM
jgi:hypothetical protein